ncbi:hypothetical protein D8674_008652 [Pyrus ussuriensis x Pyrus communis]|uniref:Uncharacterized protein n=1 Tax=Pyrus ussuriensis x Pyrus communis TaxID=2448454 RepID=A0A5N5HWE9_9ROSA|nr:hypothetical protein D8674_008652 [Pyrus ussuriensis x Pyrus communis]
MESMEYTGPSTMIIEELSEEEWDVMAITCKTREKKRGVSIEEEVTVMCSDEGFHQEEVAGISMAEEEDVQVARKGGLQDVQVDEQGVQVGEECEEEHGDTFFDVPVYFEGDQEESEEEDPKEDIVESDYGSDKDNPNFAKYDVIQEADEVQRTRRQSQKRKKR